MTPRILAVVDTAYEEDFRGPFPQSSRLKSLINYTSKFLKVKIAATPAAPVPGSLTAREYREHADWLHGVVEQHSPTHLLMLGKGATYSLGAGFPTRIAKRRKWERVIGRRFLWNDTTPALVTISPSMLFTAKNDDNAGYMQLRTVIEHTASLLREPDEAITKTYHLISDQNELRRYFQGLKSGDLLGVDIETTGLNFLRDTIFSIQFSHADHAAIVVPWNLLTDVQWKSVFEFLTKRGVRLVGQNFKFDAKFLMRRGVVLPDWLELSVLHVIEDERPGTHNLDSMAIQVLGEEKLDVDVESFQNADLAAVKDYAAADADLTRRIGQALHPVTARPIAGIMERAAHTLAKAEHFGIRVDQRALASLVERAESGLRAYDALFESYGVRNANDRVGIGRVLGLGGTTSKDVLVPLAADGNEFARAVVDARGLGKVLSTYLRRIEAGIQFDGRYHADFRLAGPSTGRTSCGSGKPPIGHEYLSINLQNIPRPAETGHEFTLLSEELRSQLRHLFIADEGHVLVGADFSAAEFRVAAALSGDQQMIADCNNKLDTHSVIAINAFSLPFELNLEDPSTFKPMKKWVEENYGHQRTIAKRGTFAALYGGGAGTIAANTGCTTGQANSILAALYGRYPDLRRYFEECHADVKRGRVESYYGRVRRFPYSTGVFGREAKEAMLREGQNFTIQSTASDYGLKALGKFDDVCGGFYQPLLFIHDAIYVQCPEDKVDDCKFQLTQYMEQADDLNGVILYADAKAAKSWGAL